MNGEISTGRKTRGTTTRMYGHRNLIYGGWKARGVGG